MFEPDGHVALATLWSEFQARHGHALCEEARARYAGLSQDRWVEFGSPADYVEDMFVKSFDRITLSLCALGEQPIGVVALDQDTGFRVLDRLSVFESTIAVTDPVGAEANASHLRIMGSSRFAPWPETAYGQESWAKVYVDGEHAATPLAKLPYHTLPYSFERNRFMVPVSLPAWIDDPLDELFVLKILPTCFGRSFCLENERARAWRNLTLKPGWRVENAERIVGRPRKLEEAAWQFHTLFPNGLEGSWKDATRTIEMKSGLKLSVRTLQRAIKAHPGNATKPSAKPL